MQVLFIQAFAQLLRYDVTLIRHDFATLHANVHLLPIASRQPDPADTARICRAVAYACIWYLKPVLCLQRSTVAVALLRRYGIHAEMVIGAQRVPLKAHAWVEVGGRVVNDKPEVQHEYLVMERC